MNRTRITVSIALTLVWLAAGCAHYTSYVRQDDGTYREKTGWLLRPMTLTDFRSFTCDKDYMVASEHLGVTYGWPKGKGMISEDFNEIEFEGEKIKCKIVGCGLTVNGKSFGEFQAGDRVRIAPDGRVFVNDVERPATGKAA
ncbi:MAG: hypothetical protein ABII12_02430 [Planctomycetota bacterium]